MNDVLHSQADAYAIGALSPNETAQFEAHLDECAGCLKEVAELREMTARLSETVATAPPAGLRSSILTQIAVTPQVAVGSREEAEPPVGAGGRHAGAAPEEGSNVVPLRASRPRRAPALLAAAAVVAAIGFGGWAWESRQDAQRDASQSRLSADAAVDQSQQLTSLLTARDVKTVPGTFVHGGSGKVVYSQSAGTAMLLAADLPEPPDGKVYEAWTIEDEVPVPAGTFGAEAATALRLPDSALDATGVAVTVEPAGGSAQPTTDAVFSVSL